ncbi:cytochrome P450 [Gloeothece verrucosa]|uniref:Cytochrome P450 n=1 Tax=Gloeothece verrucosa (strain PCC 7822) TaxID=497965 RepID=E0ULB4_GLOV7|nr:cytochrome P450 [Gloeothece verrucosa]ADN17744.1 cytochrome P450 [Gloeothece verrucosa PCC 7822]
MTNLPCSPPLSPAQQAQKWIDQPLEFLDHCFQDYGDIFTLELGALGATIFLGNPQAVETIFKLHGHLFECHQFNVSYAPLMGKNALFLQDGEAHKRLRRIMMPPFHRERVQKYADYIQEIAQESVKDWTRGKVLKIRSLMHRLALEVTLRIFFSERTLPIEKIRYWFETKVFTETKSWKPWFNYSRLQPQIRQLIREEIEFRKEAKFESVDLLNWLQLAQDEEGNFLSEEELQDQLLTLMITAVDPIAMSLTWALYWIHKLPKVKATLSEELKTLEGKLDPLAINQLPYLTAVCQETLRLHPILPTVSGRRLTTPIEVMGYHFPEGTTVAPCAYLVHRREELYPEPRSFKPERFLQNQYSAYEYFPFGGGNRLCLGAALAPLEIKIVLATILSSHDLSLMDQEPLSMVRYGTLVAPSETFQMIVIK